MGQNDMTIQSKEPARLGDSLPEGENTASFQNDVPFKKIRPRLKK
jgi:hypothetical protein